MKIPRKQKITRRSESTVLWEISGKVYKCQILPQSCPVCKASGTLIGLPAPIREKQPDETNVVCMPGKLGGCDHGFHLDTDNDCLSCRWDLK